MDAMNAVLDEKKPFLALFDESDRQPGSTRWQALRKQGRARFRELPFPGAKSEDWRFTSVAPLLKESFALSSALAIDPSLLPPLCHPQSLRLTFVNGSFAPTLSRLDAPTGGVLFGPLSEPGAAAELLTKHLARIADGQNQIFTALNTALLHDGAYLIVPNAAVLERPLEIIYVTSPGKKSPTAQPRTLVVLGKQAQATVVERFLGIGEGKAFTNAVAEFVLDEGAILDHVKIQQENLQTYHLANTQVVQARGSNLTTHSLSLGGALVRNEVRVRFDGEGCEATVNGLYLGRGTQHVDNQTVIDHAMPHCNSHELYKGILADKSHGVFNGKIFVRKDAQKTDAKQTNKVLLLSDDATINTKPQLEIFADDVKCTHGATIGQLDEQQIFYLRSRGVGIEEARRILTFAFANDVVGRIKLEAIREELETHLIEGTSVKK
jgi:Fe-S cluster assembly protein SufD